MYGLLCVDDIEIVGHSLFNNFRLALYNYLGREFIKNVTSINDLNDITHLIIVDEHHIPCVAIWKNDAFINQLNNLSIKTLVFNFEKIFSSSFPWNADHQRKLESINNLVQLVSDIDDAAILGHTAINKQFLSKDTYLQAVNVEKLDRILFIGQVNEYYPTRRQVLESARSSDLPIDIIVSDRRYTYNEFLTKLNQYKFILNPLGTGKFLNLRFYEALKLGCIPIQQITQEMTCLYPELNQSINFIEFSDITQESLLFNPQGAEIYLEDYFNTLQLKKHFDI
jgi:hypothetical protein